MLNECARMYTSVMGEADDTGEGAMGFFPLRKLYLSVCVLLTRSKHNISSSRAEVVTMVTEPVLLQLGEDS